MELRADFQRWYGINIDEVGRSVPLSHACALSACLPQGSLALAKMDPHTTLTNTDRLLLLLIEALTGERIDPFPGKRPEGGAKLRLDVDEYARRLAAPRKAVGDGD